MHTAIRWIVPALMGMLALPLAAQPLSVHDSLLAKPWKVAFYELYDQRTPPPEGERNNVFELHADHTAVSIERDRKEHGTWSYDEGKKELVVVDDGTKERMVLRVASVDAKSCTLELEDPDGTVLRMHMVTE